MLLERIERRRAPADEHGCRRWLGAHSDRGYGFVQIAGRSRPVHRLVYEELVGPIPEGHHVHHTCRVKDCTSEDHLQPVTPAEHLVVPDAQTVNARNAAKAECDHGHPFTPENTFRDRLGNRQCRACHRRRAQEHRHRARSAS